MEANAQDTVFRAQQGELLARMAAVSAHLHDSPRSKNISVFSTLPPGSYSALHTCPPGFLPPPWSGVSLAPAVSPAPVVPVVSAVSAPPGPPSPLSLTAPAFSPAHAVSPAPVVRVVPAVSALPGPPSPLSLTAPTFSPAPAVSPAPVVPVVPAVSAPRVLRPRCHSLLRRFFRLLLSLRLL
jgi:hypothetical protein